MFVRALKHNSDWDEHPCYQQPKTSKKATFSLKFSFTLYVHLHFKKSDIPLTAAMDGRFSSPAAG